MSNVFYAVDRLEGQMGLNRMSESDPGGDITL